MPLIQSCFVGYAGVFGSKFSQITIEKLRLEQANLSKKYRKGLYE